MGHESQDTGKSIAPYEDDAGYHHCSYSEGDKEVYVTFHGDDEQFDHVLEKDEELENATSNDPEENFLVGERAERCPQIGMEFGSAEDAYNFYNQYAGKMGFSVRKYSTCKSHRTSETIGRTYCCSLQGLRDVRAKRLEERIRNRANIRTGCRALMSIRKRKGDTWVVSRVVEEHNHKLAALSERHTLRSLRKIAMDQRRVIENMCLTGLNTDLVTNYMALEARGSAKTGTGGEVRTFLSTKQQRGPTEVDVRAILHYFECQQMDNPSFVYSIQVDSAGRMTNFFWTDGRSRMDYHYFGDIVCFDPSSGANKYGLPFVPIVGINHHCQTVLFGGALLYTESEESFEWVIKTWMRSMNGKPPKVILTDQESGIGGVIVRLLPGTRHQYCAWHISRDLMKNLPHVIHSHKSFTRDFDHCLYGSETIEEFESYWVAMVNSYNLENDDWLMKLYEKRETWAPVYIRDVFSASKFITQHGESLNAYFDGYVRMNMTLFEFLKQYERAVAARREAENDEDFETNHRKRVLRFSMDIEKDAARIYTRLIFENFQNELFEGLSYRHKKVEEIGMKSMYNVWKLGQENMRRIVTFNSFDSSAKCSCQLFESAGYFCRHILKVFVVEDVQNLPPQYILKRWTKDAKFGPLVNDEVGEIRSNLDEIVSVRFSKICQEAINIAVKGSTSLEVYKVAMSGLHNALRAVESVMKNGTVCPTEGNKEVESVHSYEESSGDRSANRRNNLIHLL